jgi:hypothetical protein
VHWDELLEAGRLCPAISTDDSHHPGFDSGFAWTWLRVAERTREAVLEALRDGAFYGTNGPAIQALRRTGDTIEVMCSPCRSVALVSGKTTGAAVNAGRLGYRHNAEVLAAGDDGSLYGAVLTIPPGARHGRVQVTDAEGRTAWTNPFPT